MAGLRLGRRGWYSLARSWQSIDAAAGRQPVRPCSCSSQRRLFEGVPGTRCFASAAATEPGAAASSTSSVPQPEVSNNWRRFGIAGAFLTGAAAAYYLAKQRQEEAAMLDDDDDDALEESGSSGSQSDEQHHLVNWSDTHEVHPQRFYQPETTEELEGIVAQAHANGDKIRCVGSALSPNGLSFSNDGMLSLALLDKVLAVDPVKMTVTVQPGARVQDVSDQVKRHGLALQNYASVREQSIGGFIQVSAHGTGATIPPVDEQVVSLKLITPAQGTLELSKEKDPELFNLAKVGLGALGVVSEVTLQCVPAHQLMEHTYLATATDIRKQHARLLRDNRHVRYMWIPYTDKVVVVTNNPVKEGTQPPKPWFWAKTYTEHERPAALRDLLFNALPNKSPQVVAEIESMTAFQLRDQLLALDPLNRDWVRQVNQAEADFWRFSEGYRTGWSDEILGFDCGGQQWVLEVAFPAGTLANPSFADLDYMDRLMQRIDAGEIPAPAPIEQRWTGGSAAPMSPASALGHVADPLFSWVGIIMYLPTDDPQQRQAITDSFHRYSDVVEREQMPQFGALWHWAKLEMEHRDAASKAAVQQRIREHYPVDQFNAARVKFDPKGVLSNDWINAVFPLAKQQA